MQPRLLIDTKLEKANEAYEKFGEIVDKYFQSTNNLERWDAFSRADKQLEVLNRKVSWSNPDERGPRRNEGCGQNEEGFLPNESNRE